MLAVHTEKLLIADGADDAALNRLTGTVTDVVYQGESLRVFLALDDGTALSLRQPSHHEAYRRIPPVGGSLTVTLHPQDTIIVPKARNELHQQPSPNTREETPMSLSNFKVLTFDVVGTLIDFETGVLNAVRKISGDKAAELSDDEIFASYKRGRDKHHERSSEVMTTSISISPRNSVCRPTMRPAMPSSSRCCAGSRFRIWSRR